MLDFISNMQLSFISAFLAGIITFFASCLLPLVPTYLAYLSGVSLQTDASSKRWKLVSTSVAFVAGFVTIFVILAATLQKFAFILAPYKIFLGRASGVVFILFGLFMLGFFQHPWFLKERRIDVHSWFQSSTYLHAFITGVAFGFGWTPCIGPILATILFVASQQASVWSGMFLLFVYGVGLGIPFIGVAAAYEQVMPLIKKSSKYSVWVNKIGGSLLVIAGLAFVLNLQQTYAFWLLKLIPVERLTL